MKVYVEAKSKAELIRRLAAGEEISGYNYSMFGGGGHYILDDTLEDGTIIAIYSQMSQGNPVAKSWGTWTNGVLKAETFEATTLDEEHICFICGTTKEDIEGFDDMMSTKGGDACKTCAEEYGYKWPDDMIYLDGESFYDAENWGGDPEGPLAKALDKARSADPTPPLVIESLDDGGDSQCSSCGTFDDVHECWNCDKQLCIDCDPGEMRSDLDGHTYCDNCGPNNGKKSPWECKSCGTTSLRFYEHFDKDGRKDTSLDGFFCANCELSPCGIYQTDSEPCTCDISEYGKYTFLGRKPHPQFPSQFDEDARMRILGKKSMDAESFALEQRDGRRCPNCHGNLYAEGCIHHGIMPRMRHAESFEAPGAYLFPALFKKATTGKIQEWRIRTEELPGGNWAYISSHGQLGGSMVEGKGVVIKAGKQGRSIEEQANAEAASKWKKKRDTGYFETADDAENNLVLLPMLALDHKKRGHNIEWPAIGQPKLDGIRCMARLDSSGNISLTSRKNKPFPGMDHIRDELAARLKDLGKSVGGPFPNDIVIDGELYADPDELTFQQVTGLVRRDNKKPEDIENEKKLKLNVYDSINLDDLDMDFIDRHNLVSNNLRGMDAVTIVENTPLADPDAVDPIHDQFVREGYEGLIIRNIKGPYKLNGRSKHLQKYKSFQDDEYEIVGYEEGKGNYEGTVIWVCETPDGQRFKIKPNGTHEQRSKWFDNADDYIGHKITVRFFELTDDGIPRFPTGGWFRNYEAEVWDLDQCAFCDTPIYDEEDSTEFDDEQYHDVCLSHWLHMDAETFEAPRNTATTFKKQGMWISEWPSDEEEHGDVAVQKRQREQDKKARELVKKMKSQGWTKIPNPKINSIVKEQNLLPQIRTVIKKYNADVRKKWGGKKINTWGQELAANYFLIDLETFQEQLTSEGPHDIYNAVHHFAGELGGYGAMMKKGNQYRLIMTGGTDDDEAAYWSNPVVQFALKGSPTSGKAPPKPRPKTKAKKTTRKRSAKKKTGRKAPTISATRRKIGTRMRGNDGKMWEVKRSGKSQRWIRGAEDTKWANFGYRSSNPTKGIDNLTVPFEEEVDYEEEKSHKKTILIGILCGSAIMAFISSKLK